jgi:thiamine biosynthesis lipoprotein
MNFRTATFAMGTRFEIVLEGQDPLRASAAGEAAVAVIEECDARLSRFRSDSQVSRINREADSSWVRIDPLMFELLERCARLTRDTDGGFDVCVGVPMDRVRAGSQAAEPGRAGAFELDAATSSVRFTSIGTALDFGAIGKGLALDLAAASLVEAGIERALLHGGTSSVIALGAPSNLPDGWRIALGGEFDDAVACLDHNALSVSAVRGARRPAGDGLGAAHVLDPRSGELLQSAGRAAVACASAADAEAWSTALLVLHARAQRSGDGARARLAHTPEDFDCLLTDPPTGGFRHSKGTRRAFRIPGASAMAMAQ